MSRIGNIKTFFTKPTKCYIPKCKAICCANAPLPEDFLPKHSEKIKRDIYAGINIGQNWIEDTYNSVIYNTLPSPIQLVGFTPDGKKIMGISREMVEKLQLKSMDEILELAEKYKEYPNYCPFLTDYGKCNVYAQRPPICKDFGTKTDKINICPEKATRLEVLRNELKEYLNIKENLRFLLQNLKEKFVTKQ